VHFFCFIVFYSCMRFIAKIFVLSLFFCSFYGWELNSAPTEYCSALNQLVPKLDTWECIWFRTQGSDRRWKHPKARKPATELWTETIAAKLTSTLFSFFILFYKKSSIIAVCDWFTYFIHMCPNHRLEIIEMDDSSPKMKPKHLNHLLVAGCSIGNNP